eukprot:TRINITY_DN328_c0_g2_i1.p1 TRINITY_DN328_c0_g2~~TRINITY_DN328_c0_g2_i1.p1  ORF type:complete len:173 (+),score=62.93 TRINITY_DN328_c0_g2_i1:25-519(+)
MVHYLNDDELAFLEEAFAVYAGKGSDVITAEALKGVMKSVDMPANQSDVDAMLKDAGASGGKVTKDQFLAMMGKKLKSLDSEKVILDAFTSFDPLGTSKLTAEDFNIILSEHGKGVFNGKDITAIRREAKTDDAGFISYGDFVKVMTGDTKNWLPKAAPAPKGK